MSIRGRRRLAIAALLPLLLVLVRQGAAQDVTIGPTPTPPASAPGGAVYTDPAYGWSLAYDASWTAVEEGPDRLVLTNGVSTFAFAALNEYGDDAVACLASAAESLATDARNTGVVPATGDGGEPVRGEDAAAERVWAVYLVTRGGEGLAVYLDCRKLLRGEAVLLIAQHTAVAAFNDENEPRQRLLAGLTLPVDRCGSVLAYRDGSLGRLAAARNLVETTTGPVRTMSWAEGATAVGELLDAQRAEVVPPGGEQAQRLTLETLDAWLSYMVDMDLGQQQPLGPGFDDANEAMIDAFVLEEQATLELARFAGDCAGTSAGPTPVPSGEGPPERDVTPEGGAQVWSCPPDEREIEEWRATARHLRETANRSSSLVNQQGLAAQADRWDGMADARLDYCVSATEPAG